MKRKPEVGMIAGAYDIIHPGYVKLFREFNEACEHQFVLLHNDPTIERPEKLKPILSIDERIDIISPYLSSCFFMVYNTEEELLKLITSLRPDIRLMGEDYIGERFTGDNLGIPIKWIDRSHGWSTTKYKNLIAQSI